MPVSKHPKPTPLQIRALRAVLGDTQQEFVEHFGARTEKSAHDWEHGICEPSGPVLKQMWPLLEEHQDMIDTWISVREYTAGLRGENTDSVPADGA